MSKFILNSSNYSESNLLKSKLLRPILERYNEILIKGNNKNFLNSFDTQKFVGNNNNKYYLFITDKSKFSGDKKSNYKILYFFPEIISNETSDFFIEMDYNIKFSKSYLFEGYIYNQSIHPHFMITDILSIDMNIINCNYDVRSNMIYDIIGIEGINNINCNLNIGIHPIFNYNIDEYESILYIFKNNFIYKKEINSIEIINIGLNHIPDLKKIKKCIINKETKELKSVVKTKYSDVYNVFNIESGDNEGILYIKSILISKEIKKIFNNKTRMELECEYNNTFFKWCVSFNS